ncbi:MAG: hypothetical protein SFY81_15160 [Verrucomicrobiota bacterium]|nr:hypothetical protein [Verrucomicrobiota bacterium]
MDPIPKPFSFQVEAAEGWMMLGDPQSAAEELARLPAEYQDHPNTLAVKWSLHALLEQWEEAWQISRKLCDALPHCAGIWVCHAESTRKHKGIQEALNVLSGVAGKFPRDASVSYQLACLCTLTGHIEEARYYLKKAFVNGDAKKMRLTALRDPDLQPLWERADSYPLLALKDEETE